MKKKIKIINLQQKIIKHKKEIQLHIKINNINHHSIKIREIRQIILEE